MMTFLTTPLFFLTPYIFIWSILNGLIVVGLLKLLKLKTSRETLIATALTTAIASILWNWSIAFNQSTIYLNVDHPYLRISWADALNGICVYALTAFVLVMFINPQEPARVIAKIAGIAALLTIFTDTFFF
jgi:fucose 4-O-acetylase-like acetyltransferase